MSNDHELQPKRTAGPEVRAPAGWYQDPEHPDWVRYWDGDVWFTSTPVHARDIGPAAELHVPRESWPRQSRRHPRWVVGVLVVGLLVITALGLYGCVWAPRSLGPSVPIGKEVTAHITNLHNDEPVTDTTWVVATFTVAVDSIQCGSGDCIVSLRVRNEGTVAAQYDCYQTKATDLAGHTYGSLAAGLGNMISGCDATAEHPPGVWDAVSVTLFDAGGHTLSTLHIAGDGTLQLPAGIS